MLQIECKLGDSPKLKGELPVLKLGAPFSMTLKRGDSKAVDTGVSFNVPVILFQYQWIMTHDGVRLANNATVVMPGEKISLVLDAVSGDAFIENGQSVANVVPLIDDKDRSVKYV